MKKLNVINENGQIQVIDLDIILDELEKKIKKDLKPRRKKVVEEK